MRRMMWLAAVVGAAGVVGIGVAVAAAITAPAKAELAADAIPLGTALGQPWYLGGFSGLAPNGNSGKEYWTITDRGPNQDLPCAATGNGLQFPLPAYAPEIVQIGVKGSELKVKARIPLRFASGAATGLPVRTGKNELGYGPGGCAGGVLPLSPGGVDSEGVVVDPRDGSFWIADEYLPSVMHVTSDGLVVTRIVPTGTGASITASGTNVVEAFPAIVGSNFRSNRGFEDVALSPDGRWLYTSLQSPMDNPSRTSPPPSPNPRNSLAIRVFRIDLANPAQPVVDREWVYKLDKAAGNSPLADKVSGLVWDGTDRLLVEERDDPIPADANPQNTMNTRVYRADFTAASNILGTVWDETPAPVTTDSRTLEQWLVPGASGTPATALPATAPKCLWSDLAVQLSAAGFRNGKIEGISTIPARGSNPPLLAVINDNDFGIAAPIPEQLNVLPFPATQSCTPA